MAECSTMDELDEPICPVCAATMTFEKTVNGLFVLPELRTYACRRCAVFATVEDTSSSENHSVH